jgi:hypothetical protein
MSEASQGVDYFNRGHLLTSVQERFSLAARKRMFAAWEAFAGPLAGKSVLDVGSTPDRERRDSNCMVPWLHEQRAEVSLYSPEDLQGLSAVFPYARILPSAGFGAAIPAADRSYDWTVSSAVLEHAGGPEAQTAFIADCARVAHGIFLTTPNRWHWLEFHTKLPLLHWLPREAHRAVLRTIGLETWARESHLRLVGRSELKAMAVAALGSAFRIEVEAVWTLGMPSNLVLLASRRPGC